MKRSCLPCNLLSFFRSCSVNRAPVHDTSRRIARLATLSFPAYGVNIFSTAKQASKKRNFLLSCRGCCDVADGYVYNRNCKGTGINPSSTSVSEGVCFGAYGRPIRNTRPSSSESHQEWNMASLNCALSLPILFSTSRSSESKHFDELGRWLASCTLACE